MNILIIIILGIIVGIIISAGIFFAIVHHVEDMTDEEYIQWVEAHNRIIEEDDFIV